jgi:hypothetical protein
LSYFEWNEKKLFNTTSIQKLTEGYVVSNAKIVAAIGKRMPVGAKEGLLRTMEGFKELWVMGLKV